MIATERENGGRMNLFSSSCSERSIRKRKVWTAFSVIGEVTASFKAHIFAIMDSGSEKFSRRFSDSFRVERIPSMLGFVK